MEITAEWREKVEVTALWQGRGWGHDRLVGEGLGSWHGLEREELRPRQKNRGGLGVTTRQQGVIAGKVEGEGVQWCIR